jgi:hypothetical protein
MTPWEHEVVRARDSVRAVDDLVIHLEGWLDDLWTRSQDRLPPRHGASTA